MSDKIKLSIARCMIIIGIIVAGLALFLPENYRLLMVGIGGVIAVIGFIFAIVFARCSFCRRMLPLIGFGTTSCPYCGSDLSEKQD